MLLGTVLAAAGVGSLLAALTVAYRDFRYVVPFLIQLWMFVTPVIYPVSFIPSRYHWLIDLNPFTAVVNGFRWSLLGQPFGSLAALGASILIALGITMSGLFIFRSTERVMVDML